MEFPSLQAELDDIQARAGKASGGMPGIPMNNLPCFNSKRSIAPHPGFQEASILSEKMHDNMKYKSPQKESPSPSFGLPEGVIFDNLRSFLARRASYLRMEDLEKAKTLACQVLQKGPQASLPLLQMCHDVLYNVIETGASFQADQFLNNLLLTFISMQYLKVNEPQSSIEEQASHMSRRAFQRRSSNKYLESATSADKRSVDPNLELLKRECQKSLIDLIFKIRMRKLVSLVQAGPRSEIAKRKLGTRQGAQPPHVLSQPHLHCCLPSIPQPPCLPNKPAVGGFWSTESL